MQDYYIRCEGRFRRLDLGLIRYIESVQNYIRIQTGDNSYLILMSMRQIEEELPADQFCRVHRRYIVGMAHIESFDKEWVYLSDRVIPVSNFYRSALQAKVRVLISDTRVGLNVE